MVVIDNAQYHAARLHRPWREVRAERFALDILPAYSPELNPIQRVWKLTRRRCLLNRYFAQLNDVMLAGQTEFADWIKPDNAVRRLCAIT